MFIFLSKYKQEKHFEDPGSNCIHLVIFDNFHSPIFKLISALLQYYGSIKKLRNQTFIFTFIVLLHQYGNMLK